MNKNIIVILVAVVLLAFAVSFYLYLSGVPGSQQGSNYQNNLPEFDYSANTTLDIEKDLNEIPNGGSLEADEQSLEADVNSW